MAKVRTKKTAPQNLVPPVRPVERTTSVRLSAAATSFVPGKHTLDDIPSIPYYNRKLGRIGRRIKSRRRVVSMPVFSKSVEVLGTAHVSDEEKVTFSEMEASDAGSRDELAHVGKNSNRNTWGGFNKSLPPSPKATEVGGTGKEQAPEFVLEPEVAQKRDFAAAPVTPSAQTFAPPLAPISEPSAQTEEFLPPAPPKHTSPTHFAQFTPTQYYTPRHAPQSSEDSDVYFSPQYTARSIKLRVVSTPISQSSSRQKLSSSHQNEHRADFVAQSPLGRRPLSNLSRDDLIASSAISQTSDYISASSHISEENYRENHSRRLSVLDPGSQCGTEYLRHCYSQPHSQPEYGHSDTPLWSSLDESIVRIFETYMRLGSRSSFSSGFSSAPSQVQSGALDFSSDTMSALSIYSDEESEEMCDSLFDEELEQLSLSERRYASTEMLVYAKPRERSPPVNFDQANIDTYMGGNKYADQRQQFAQNQGNHQCKQNQQSHQFTPNSRADLPQTETKPRPAQFQVDTQKTVPVELNQSAADADTSRANFEQEKLLPPAPVQARKIQSRSVQPSKVDRRRVVSDGHLLQNPLEFCLDLGAEYDKSRFMIPDCHKVRNMYSPQNRKFSAAYSSYLNKSLPSLPQGNENDNLKVGKRQEKEKTAQKNRLSEPVFQARSINTGKLETYFTASEALGPALRSLLGPVGPVLQVKQFVRA